MSDESSKNHISMATMRRELKEFMRQTLPEFEVTEERDDSMIAVGPSGGEHQLFFENMHRTISDLSNNTLASRQGVYSSFTQAMKSSGSIIDSPASQLAKQLMPRIVHANQLRSMLQQIDVPVPHRTLGALPIMLVYVIDLPESVAYVNQETAAQLELSEPEMYEQAVRNLDPEGVFRNNIRNLVAGHVAVVKTGDTFDAARLLLVPPALDEHKVLCAAIPDRDTLVLSVMDSEQVFETVDHMAKIPGSDRLIYDQAIEVRSTGFTTRA